MNTFVNNFLPVIVLLLLVGLMFMAAGTSIETNPNGYIVVLLDGSEKTLNYDYCVPKKETGLFKDSEALFVKCGHWSSRNRFTATLVLEYEAQIISFQKK